MATTLMRTTRAVTTVLFALAVSAIAGCAGENPAPTFTPRTLPPDATQHVPEEYEEPNPSPEPDAELVPPVIPPENREFDLDGAEATARYYLAAFEYGYASLDSGPLERISTTGCGTCALHIERINDLKLEDKTFYGGEVAVDEVAGFYDNGDRVIVVLTATQEQSYIYDIADTVSEPGTSAELEILVVFENGEWLVDAVGTEEINS